MVKYPFWVQKNFLHYTTQHEGGRHIELSISPGQTTANNCKTASSRALPTTPTSSFDFFGLFLE